MSKNFTTARFLLGVATVASGTGDPNAGAGTPGHAGSLWIRQGNGGTQPTLPYQNLDGDPKGWQVENLVNLKVYNVKEFGAVGDGIVDDTVAINAAVTAALVGGVGGTIYFPPGTFRVTRPASGLGSVVLSNAHNLVFMGDGAASTISMIGSASFGDWYMFRLRNGTSRIKFLNLHFTSIITNPDAAEQHHFINLSGVTGDANGGPRDVDVIGCYFGTIPGAGVRNLGEAGQICSHISVHYNDFDMTNARSCVEAQRYSDAVDVSHNFMQGSNDQQLDFEPTAGDGPTNWTIVGNHINHAASNAASAVTLSGTGNATVSQANRRLVCAFNTVTNGGAISGLKGLVNADLIGNVVINDQTVANSGNAPLDFGQRVQDCTFVGNICINPTPVNNRTGFRVIASPINSAPAERIVVSENIVVAMGTASITGISVSDTTETVVEGNVVTVDTTVANVSAGIAAVSVNEVVDHVVSVGNLVLGLTSALKTCINYACSGFDLRNVSANYNLVKNGVSIVTFSRITTEQFLDWRGIQYNNGVSISGQPVQINIFEGVTVDGNAGPGCQVSSFQNSTGGPEGIVTAAVGSYALNVSGVAGTILWMKESGVGVSGGKAGWVSQGPCEISMGVQDTGIGTAALFIAPGSGLAVPSATEISFALPRSGTIRNLRYAGVAGVGGGTTTYTLRRNGANTSAVVVPATASASAIGTGLTVVSAGDRISMSVAKSVIPTAGQSQVVITFELTA